MPLHNHLRARNARVQHGYTLPELMVSLAALALLLAGVASVFILMLRLSGSVTSASLSSTDASNALQRITGDMREANSFALPGSSAYVGPLPATGTDTNGNLVVTGITIVSPVPYISSLSADGKIYYTTGANVSKGPLTGGNVPYNISSPNTQAVSFYRANWQQPNGADGTPNPTSGKCLWAVGYEPGQDTTQPPLNGPVIKTIAPTADAVQFIVPRQADGTQIANEAEIKIVSGQYDPIHGTATSDSAGGGTTALTGDCVYLRDHNPTPPSPGGSSGKVYFGG